MERTRLAGQGQDAVDVSLAALRSVKGGAEVDGSTLEGGGGGKGREGDDGESGELHFCGDGLVVGGWWLGFEVVLEEVLLLIEVMC